LLFKLVSIVADATRVSLTVRRHHLIGGGKRDRTADLLHAMQALSQLSYTPIASYQPDRAPNRHRN
jgi:hypothetical protein